MITRHVRGRPCTRSQLELTSARLIALASAIGAAVCLAAIAVLLVWITMATFGGFTR
jgi:hypothetical protein